MWTTLARWVRRRSDDDFADEIQSHIAMEADRLVASGMSDEDARDAARRAFGNLTTVRERFHESRPGSSLEWIAQDVRYALRGMRRNPGFTTIAVASLALGIGANVTIFGVIDTLLLRAPAQVRDINRIQRLYFETPSPSGEAVPSPTQGYKTYVALRDGVHGFESVGAFWKTKVSSGRGYDARSIDAVAVTPSMFTLLGVRPALGRFFSADEERDEGDHVVVLGYDAWRAWFAGDSAVLGRHIDVAGLPYTIVGVAPERFTGLNRDRVDMWLPLGVASRLLFPRALDPVGNSYWLEIIAKRRADASVASLEENATRVYRDVNRNSGPFAEQFRRSRVLLGPAIAARGPAPDASARVSEWIAAVSVLVLLIACANVTNLLLLRGLTRARETALRASLGAGRSRLMRHALVEGLLLALAGGLCAIVLARWTSASMRAFLLPNAAPRAQGDLRLIAYALTVAIVTGLLASFMPARMAARRDFGPLVNAGRSAGSERLRLQRILIMSQVGLAMVLLVGAGLFVASLRNVRAIDLGLDVDHLLYVNLGGASSSRGRGADTASTVAEYRSMLDRVRQIPGVRSATLTAGEPFMTGWAIALRARGAPALREGSAVPFARGVGSDYFETMGTTLRQGRFFDAADHSPSAHVAIIDEATAHAYWPGGSALGQCAYLGDQHECTQIVGIVANSVMWEVTGDKGHVVYLPLESPFVRGVSMMEVRTAGDPAALVPAVRQAVISVSPTVPWVDITPVSRRYETQLKPWRLGASMFSAFGALALGLAAIGLYGLLSYVVTQRTREIGVRKALGASDRGVLRMIVGDALGMTVIGAAAGVAISLVAVRFIAHLLYGVSPRDPTVIAAGAAVLIAAAIMACLAPARRALGVDPVVALRAE